MAVRRRSGREIDNRTVTRAIGGVVWQFLREAGFESFTGRNAWRYASGDIDVVNLRSFGGMESDSVGCTSFSFQANLGLWRAADALTVPREHDGEGRPRPQEYECEPHRIRLRKSLAQPWFRPFRADTRTWPASFRLHQAALKQIFRSDTHDVREIWFVLADGSNLEECIEDAKEALRTQGLPWFETLRG